MPDTSNFLLLIRTEEGKGYPLQYSGPENSTDCRVHGVANSWTRLSDEHLSWRGIQQKLNIVDEIDNIVLEKLLPHQYYLIK